MFEEAHESFERLRRLFAGQGSPAEADRAAAHLMRCRACWLLATRAMAFQQKAGGVVTVQAPLRSLLDLHEREQARLEAGLDAQGNWAAIRSLGIKARRDKVRLTRSLHTASFLEVLLAEGTVANAPAESEELFYLALLVAGQLPSSEFSVEWKSDLCAECCAELANARRRSAKWPAARDALKKGTEYAERGSKDRIAEGKVLCVEGALEDDLGNIEEAARILRRAAGLFETAEETFLISRTLTQLAHILFDLDPAESLRVVEKALALIPANDPRLALIAEGIRMNCLVTIGAPQEALLRLDDLKESYEQFREPVIQLRRRYTEARILENLGRPQKAESLFQEVIAGDLEHGLVKDFYLDLVYLFGFHLRRGQSSEAIAVCRRAGQELSLLEDEEGLAEPARDQMREVWRSLEEEVRRGTVDLGAPAVLRSYIKAHWRTPASEPPSFRGENRPG
jgi:tetratricopeptide (TPR) repeat protein